MKKIVEFRKLLNVDKTVELKELKTIILTNLQEMTQDFMMRKKKAKALLKHTTNW